MNDFRVRDIQCQFPTYTDEIRFLISYTNTSLELRRIATSEPRIPNAELRMTPSVRRWTVNSEFLCESDCELFRMLGVWIIYRFQLWRFAGMNEWFIKFPKTNLNFHWIGRLYPWLRNKSIVCITPKVTLKDWSKWQISPKFRKQPLFVNNSESSPYFSIIPNLTLLLQWTDNLHPFCWNVSYGSPLFTENVIFHPLFNFSPFCRTNH